MQRRRDLGVFQMYLVLGVSSHEPSRDWCSRVYGMPQGRLLHHRRCQKLP